MPVERFQPAPIAGPANPAREPIAAVRHQMTNAALIWAIVGPRIRAQRFRENFPDGFGHLPILSRFAPARQRPRPCVRRHPYVLLHPRRNNAPAAPRVAAMPAAARPPRPAVWAGTRRTSRPPSPTGTGRPAAFSWFWPPAHSRTGADSGDSRRIRYRDIRPG